MNYKTETAMKQIRSGLFETNSSSTHSIVVSGENRGYDYELPIDENGILVVEFGEFGWGPDILRTPLDKISYYITDNTGRIGWSDKSWELGIKEFRETEACKKLESVIKKHCPEFKKLEFANNSNNYYKFGYVDHQSGGTSRDADLEELIFNNSYIILIDNDNSGHFEDYSEPDLYEKGGRPHKNIEELFDGTWTD